MRGVERFAHNTRAEESVELVNAGENITSSFSFGTLASERRKSRNMFSVCNVTFP